jgi:hypothetical protein
MTLTSEDMKLIFERYCNENNLVCSFIKAIKYEVTNSGRRRDINFYYYYIPEIYGKVPYTDNDDQPALFQPNSVRIAGKDGGSASMQFLEIDKNASDISINHTTKATPIYNEADFIEKLGQYFTKEATNGEYHARIVGILEKIMDRLNM